MARRGADWDEVMGRGGGLVRHLQGCGDERDQRREQAGDDDRILREGSWHDPAAQLIAYQSGAQPEGDLHRREQQHLRPPPPQQHRCRHAREREAAASRATPRGLAGRHLWLLGRRWLCDMDILALARATRRWRVHRLCRGISAVCSLALGVGGGGSRGRSVAGGGRTFGAGSIDVTALLEGVEVVDGEHPNGGADRQDRVRHGHDEIGGVERRRRALRRRCRRIRR